MPGLPTVAEKLRSKGPFRPDAKLDRSQIVDVRLAPMMDRVHWEDDTYSFEPARHPGGLNPPKDSNEAVILPAPKKRDKQQRLPKSRRLTGLATYGSQVK